MDPRQHPKAVRDLLGGENELKIGLAHKFLNLFLKDLWAFQEVSDDTSELFHIPLDAIVLAVSLFGDRSPRPS